MSLPPDKPIQLTARQTELLTRAMSEAVKEAAIPKASETEIIKKPAPATPVPPAAKQTTID
jgi:hypothetical protein